MKIKENKWVKFQKLGIEVNFEQKQNNKVFKDIKIPKGQRLLKIKELDEVMSYIIKNKLDIWSFFEQSFKTFKTKYVAGFWANSVRAYLDCDVHPEYSDSSLGVIFCKNSKEKKK